MTAEEKFREVFTLGFAAMPPHIPKYIYEAMIEFAQYHVEQALKEAADKNLSFKSKTLQRQEILNAYPKENIK